MKTALLQTDISGVAPPIRGKVRDIYDLGNGELLFVATDRISCFDVIMTNGIPGKGIVLTQISKFWFELLEGKVKHHMITCDVSEFPEPFCDHPELIGRSMLVKKVETLPVECIIRSYLTGSGWKDYLKTGFVCGHKIPSGMQQCDKLPELLFTPSTKAELGDHDENITFEDCKELVGVTNARYLRNTSKLVFEIGSNHAETHGIILADTKFEWGVDENKNIILIDEVLTPDSSRFWPGDKYQSGRDQESFDKQFVRNYLEEINFDKNGKGIVLPPSVVMETKNKYIEAYEKLTGNKYIW